METDPIKILYGNVTVQPITDEIIAKFVAMGAPEADLQAIKAEGGMYCPERNSFIFPPNVTIHKDAHAKMAHGHKRTHKKNRHGR